MKMIMIGTLLESLVSRAWSKNVFSKNHKSKSTTQTLPGIRAARGAGQSQSSLSTSYNPYKKIEEKGKETMYNTQNRTRSYEESFEWEILVT